MFYREGIVLDQLSDLLPVFPIRSSLCDERTKITRGITIATCSVQALLIIAMAIAVARASIHIVLSSLNFQEQYIFIHEAILETILCGMNEVDSSRIQMEVKNLAQVQASGMTGFQEKFKVCLVKN